MSWSNGRMVKSLTIIAIVELGHDPVTQMPFDPGGQDPSPSHTIEDESRSSQLPTFHPSDLVGCTFLLDPQEDGWRFCTCIIQAIEEQDAEFHSNAKWFKFCCSINDDQYEEILSYSEILNYIEQQDDDGTKLWKFRCIIAHEGLLKPSNFTYKGSKYHVMIEWENGKVTSEPLTIIAADDPVTCTIYARENDLLDLDGWNYSCNNLANLTLPEARCIGEDIIIQHMLNDVTKKLCR